MRRRRNRVVADSVKRRRSHAMMARVEWLEKELAAVRAAMATHVRRSDRRMVFSHHEGYRPDNIVIDDPDEPAVTADIMMNFNLVLDHGNVLIRPRISTEDTE